MGAVLYRMRSVLRGRLLATLAVTLIIAVVCGVVIAFAAGAHRTSTAPDRYTAAFGGEPDGLVVQDDRGRPRDREIAALPGVDAVDATTFVFGGIADENGNPLDFSLVFAGSFRPSGVALVDGRAADPDNEHEFVATRNFVEQAHAHLRDSFTLLTQSVEQSLQGFTNTEPEGPRADLELVGIVDGASELDDPTPIAFISDKFTQADVGLSETLMWVDLHPGVDLPTLRAEMDDRLSNPTSLSLEPGVLISSEVRSAVNAQARGVWILAAVAAIAAIAVLGQVLTRQVRPTQEERHRLSAIGFTRTQITLEALGRAVIPIVVGSLLGSTLAVTASGLFPLGFSRVLEPTPGIRLDWLVLTAGASLFMVALTLWTFASLGLSGRTKPAARPSAAIEAVATRATSVTAGVGLRMAFTHQTRERGSVRGAVAGVLLSVAGVVAALTFGVSVDRLLHEPFRYGSNYDASVGDNGGETLPDGLVERLDANPDVSSLTLFAGGQARSGDRTIPLLGLQLVRGSGQPTMLEGRLPESDDEIAFGRLTAKEVGAHIGDSVTLTGPTQAQVFRVTGFAAVPGLGANDGLGSGGIVTMGGLHRVDANALVTSAAVKLKISFEQFFSSIPEFADAPPNPTFKPPAIVNVSRIRAIPFVLAAVLAVLALLTAGHGILTSVRSRRRDLAILRSLGADHGWITRAVHWQATTLTALPVIVGIPLGIVVGRLVFAAFADSMGAVHDAALPLFVLTLGAIAMVVFANAVAVVGSGRNRWREPALLLQGE